MTAKHQLKHITGTLHPLFSAQTPKARATIPTHRGFVPQTRLATTTKAISSKEFTRLAGLFAQVLRCRTSYIAVLCACCSALTLHKNPVPLGKIISGKRLSSLIDSTAGLPIVRCQLAVSLQLNVRLGACQQVRYR
jgi:hypothetical protein